MPTKKKLSADELVVSSFETTPSGPATYMDDGSIVGCTYDETCRTLCRICPPVNTGE